METPTIRLLHSENEISVARELFTSRIAFEWGVSRHIPESWFNNDASDPTGAVFGLFMGTCFSGVTVLTPLSTMLHTCAPEEAAPLLTALEQEGVELTRTYHWGGHALHPTVQRCGYTTLLHYTVLGWCLARGIQALVGQSPAASHNPRAAALIPRCGMRVVPGTHPFDHNFGTHIIPLRWVWKKL